ncbi:toxin glutamine deamidase domain-containing protein [Kribbella sp. NPDC003505]|uniref:toxin glutamine deamidase domain-containing protein n=1 Tax=Kribbella sp. NPDC003505 TaxID=3154448 RepID=UPI0033A63178
MPLVNPDGLPDLIPGNLDYVESNGRNLSDVGQFITDTGAAVSQAFWRLQGVYVAPEAYQLMTTINPAYNECARVGNAIKDAGNALQCYVREVRPLHERLERTKREAYTFLEVIDREVTSEGEDWNDHENIIADNNRLAETMSNLVLEILGCQVRWANKIEAIYGGAGWNPETMDRNWQPGMPYRPSPKVISKTDEPVYPPWGGYEEWDKPWIMDVGDFAVDVVDSLTVMSGLQWLLREKFHVRSMFGHETADMYTTFDAWGEAATDFVALIHAIPGVGDAMDMVTPDGFGEDLDARFDAQIDDIREDWDSGNQVRAVAGVLGFVPGLGKLATIATKTGRFAGLAGKVPTIGKIADAAGAYLGFKAEIRASVIRGATRLPVLGNVLKGISHIPILGETVRIHRGVPLGKTPEIPEAELPDPHTPTQPHEPPAHSGVPGQPADPRKPADPGRVAVPGEPVDPGRPAVPSHPVDPRRPVDPGRSVVPGRPSVPGEPVDPGHPVDPRRPVDPGRTVVPGHPVDPGRSMGRVDPGGVNPGDGRGHDRSGVPEPNTTDRGRHQHEAGSTDKPTVTTPNSHHTRNEPDGHQEQQGRQEQQGKREPQRRRDPADPREPADRHDPADRRDPQERREPADRHEPQGRNEPRRRGEPDMPGGREQAGRDRTPEPIVNPTQVPAGTPDPRGTNTHPGDGTRPSNKRPDPDHAGTPDRLKPPNPRDPEHDPNDDRDRTTDDHGGERDRTKDGGGDRDRTKGGRDGGRASGEHDRGAARYPEPAPFVPGHAAPGADTGHLARAAQSGSRDGVPERNTGDGVPAKAIGFIGARVRRFYSQPGARIELLDRGSERYGMFAGQARAELNTPDLKNRARKGREYLAEALDGSHRYAVVASVGDRIASAISLDVRRGELQLNKLGSTAGVPGAATAVEHFIARYAAENGGLPVTSEMPLDDALEFHHNIGRRTDRLPGSGLSEWSAPDVQQIAKQTESLFDHNTSALVRRDFADLHAARVAGSPSGIDPGATAGRLVREADRFREDGGRVEVVENDTGADTHVDLGDGQGVTVPAKGRSFVSYDGRGRPASVLSIRDTPTHVQIEELRLGGAPTPGSVESGVRELVRHASRSGRDIRGRLTGDARTTFDRSLGLEHGRTPAPGLPSHATTEIFHHLPEGERPPVHRVEPDGTLHRAGESSAAGAAAAGHAGAAETPGRDGPSGSDGGRHESGGDLSGSADRAPQGNAERAARPEARGRSGLAGERSAHRDGAGRGEDGGDLGEIGRRLLGEDDPGRRGAETPGGDRREDRGGDQRGGVGRGDPDISRAAKWRPGDEKLIESVRSDRQRTGGPGEYRPAVRPVLWESTDPDGSKLQRLRDSLPDDRIEGVDDWADKLDGGSVEELATRTGCAERFRAFAEVLQGGEPRVAPGNAFGTGEGRAEMWEWLGGRPGDRRHDPRLGTPEAFTSQVYSQLERSLRGSPPGTVVYLGVDWHGGSGHAFGAFVDRRGGLRWWDGNRRLYDEHAPVTGTWPPSTQPLRWLEVAMRRPGERWLTPGRDGRWGELGKLPDESHLIDYRYPRTERPATPGTTRQAGEPSEPPHPGTAGSSPDGNVERMGRNEIRSTPEGAAVRVTVREAVGPDVRGRHLPWPAVDRLVPRDATVNASAWQRMGDEWDRWIGTGHEVRAELQPSLPGDGAGKLTVRYEVVDPRTGRTLWDGGRGVFDHTGGAVLRHPDGRLETFGPTGTPAHAPLPDPHTASTESAPHHTSEPAPHNPLPPATRAEVPVVHRGNGRRVGFGEVFPELLEVNPDRPGLPPRRAWMNCEGSVIAAELTLRGQPASAVLVDPLELDGSQRVRMAQRVGLPYATFREVGDFGEIAREIAAAGDGARGLVCGYRSFLGIPTSGHVFMVVNRHGRVYYVDPQQRGWARLERFSGGLELLRTNYGSNEGQQA